MNGYQIFVRSSDVQAIVTQLRDYVARVGSAAAASIKSEKPSPALAARTERTFIVSTPEHDYVVVWEDGSWADRGLAKDLSKSLATQVIWLMVSSVTDTWGYVTYANGRQVDEHEEAADSVVDRASRFAAENHLPYALVFFEDPNAEDEYQKLLARMKATRGPDSPFHQIDTSRRAVRSRDASLKRFPESARVPRELKHKVAKFQELRLPVKPAKKQVPPR
jgi:hypothetical protein